MERMEHSFTKFPWLNNNGFKPPPGQNLSSPIHYFQLFVTDELLPEIVTESNRYAQEKIQKITPLRKQSMWWSWKDVDLVEMKAFFGVIINMDKNPKPEISDYFSSEWVDHQPYFKDIFFKERFHQIFWTLHVSPSPTGPVSGTLTRSGRCVCSVVP